jgi:PAS domain S-box-containing protein
MSMVLANTLVIGGAILGYIGLGRFVGKKISQVHNYVLLAAFVCVHTYFTLVQPNQAARNLNVTVGLLIICFQCMWFLMYGVEPNIRGLTLGVGMVFGAYCLVSTIRIVGSLTGTLAANDFFRSGAFESIILISYQMLFILLTYSLVLMVNKRLLVEVKTQEEKFAKAFHSSPYAITLTRLSDGQIIEVNDGFSNITGYPYAEAIGKTTIDLHLWDREEDRVIAVNELSKSGKVQGREFQFRKKSGEMITGLFSADIIPINNQEFVLSSISDITERKKAEQALRESEAKANALIQYAPTGIYEIDYRGPSFISVNDAMCQILGYSREELFSIGPSALLDDKSRAFFADRIRRQLAGEKIAESVEYRVRKKDGSFIDAILNVSLNLVGGEPGRALVVAHDITERKQAEVRMQTALQRFYTILSNMYASILLVADDDRIEFINQALCDFFELKDSPADLIGLTSPQMLEKIKNSYKHPDEEINRIREIVDRGQPVKSEEIAMRGDRTCLRDFIPIYLNGKSYGRLWHHLEITERKRAEEKLRQTRAKLDAALASMTDAVFVSDAQGRFIDFNDAFATFHRFKTKDECAKTFAEYPDILDVFMADGTLAPLDMWAVPRALRGETVTNTEYTLRRKDTGEIWVGSYSFGPIRAENGEIIGSVVVGREITERKRMEEELRRSRDELELRVRERTEELERSHQRLQQLSSQLLQAQEKERKRVAVELHDSLLSELAAMKFIFEAKLMLLKKGELADTNEFDKVTDIMQKVMKDARGIMNNLRPSILDEMGLIPTIGWLTQEYQKAYGHIQIHKQVEVLEKDIPEVLKVVIFRVLQEALNNFARHGRGNLVELSLLKSGDALELRIQDNGQGFDVGKVQKGVGLESMRERVELSGGSFDVESTAGRGTTIRASWSFGGDG